MVDDGHAASSPDSVTITVLAEHPGDVNIAALATVTASSENVAGRQEAVKAVDGSPWGTRSHSTREWATVGEDAGAWLKLDWPIPYEVNRIVLNDRPQQQRPDHRRHPALQRRQQPHTGPLPNDGAPLTLTSRPAPSPACELGIDAVSSTTVNVGLAEIEVFAHPPGGIDSYTLTYTAGAHGSLTGSSPQTVAYGA